MMRNLLARLAKILTKLADFDLCFFTYIKCQRNYPVRY